MLDFDKYPKLLTAGEFNRSEDEDPAHTIARKSHLDVANNGDILSKTVNLASISICRYYANKVGPEL